MIEYELKVAVWHTSKDETWNASLRIQERRARKLVGKAVFTPIKSSPRCSHTQFLRKVRDEANTQLKLLIS